MVVFFPVYFLSKKSFSDCSVTPLKMCHWCFNSVVFYQRGREEFRIKDPMINDNSDSMFPFSLLLGMLLQSQQF